MTEASDSSQRFYDALAPLFDVMTDWDARLATEGPFLRGVLERTRARTVFDAACGSGGHALALKRWGYEVAGADASPVMVEMARRKADAEGLNIPFAVAEFGQLELIAPGPFDAVLCLGNSLPHLPDQAELVATLRSMSAILVPGGVLVLQNLNYDRRWKVRPRWFTAQGGVLEGEEVLVWRFADYHDDTMVIGFNIALFRKREDGWQVEVHTTPHRPVFQRDLMIALEEAGLGEAESYGGMGSPGPAFDPDTSGDLILVARKL